MKDALSVSAIIICGRNKGDMMLWHTNTCDDQVTDQTDFSI